MSSEYLYLTKQEQKFLMDMLEITNPTQAMEMFVSIMAEERVKTEDMQKYIKRIMAVDIEKYMASKKKK